MVNTQANTMFIAIFHLMPEIFVTAPTPIIDPDMVCVVETGIPRLVARKRVSAPDVSALKPCTGFNFVSFIPIVFTIRQPPIAVPMAIARWQERMIHKVFQ